MHAQGNSPSLRPAGAGHLRRDGVDPAEWLAQHRFTPVVRRHADEQRPPIRASRTHATGTSPGKSTLCGQLTTGEEPDDAGSHRVGDPDRARLVQADAVRRR